MSEPRWSRVRRSGVRTAVEQRGKLVRAGAEDIVELARALFEGVGDFDGALAEDALDLADGAAESGGRLAAAVSWRVCVASVDLVTSRSVTSDDRQADVLGDFFGRAASDRRSQSVRSGDVGKLGGTVGELAADLDQPAVDDRGEFGLAVGEGLGDLPGALDQGLVDLARAVVESLGDAVGVALERVGNGVDARADRIAEVGELGGQRGFHRLGVVADRARSAPDRGPR